MHSQRFMQSLADANFNSAGPKALKLFTVKEEFFVTLKNELQRLTERYSPSHARDHDHATRWTNPFGAAVQFSLLNESGRLDDTSTDHNLSVARKAFHFASEFPTVAQFVNAFPHALNMRLNGMGRKSGLAPHEENIVHWCGMKKPNQFFLRVRFHLPIQTNEQALLLLDGETFHFQDRTVYFFNNGTVHSANNQGDTYRYHLVWDMLLTRQTYELMFLQQQSPEFLVSVPEHERHVAPSGKVDIDDYAISGLGLRLYRLLQLERFGIKRGTFHSQLYSPVARQLPLKLDFADVR